jgi:uncharacterized RDD family membrane protein YckC
MELFKKKLKEPDLIVTCGQCGAKLESAAECPMCKEVSKSLPAAVGKSELVTANREFTPDEPDEHWEVFRRAIRPASFWRRLAAAIVDACILFSVIFILELGPALLMMLYFVSPQFCLKLLNSQLKVIVIASEYFLLYAVPLLLPFLYFGRFESSHLRGTPGKRLAGLMVIGANSHRISFWQAVFKTGLQDAMMFLGSYALGAILFAVYISYSYIFYSSRSQKTYEGFAALPLLMIDSALFCAFWSSMFLIPHFRSKSQTFVDKAAGRFVVYRDDISDKLWSSKESERSKATGTSRVAEKITLALKILLPITVAGLCCFSAPGFRDVIKLFAVCYLPFGLWDRPELVASGLLLTFAVALFLAWKFIIGPLASPRSLAIGTVIFFGLSFTFAFCTLAPLEVILFDKSFKGVQAVEEGFRLDPKAQKSDAQERLSQAIESYPHICGLYRVAANACENWALPDQEVEFRFKAIVLELLEQGVQRQKNPHLSDQDSVNESPFAVGGRNRYEHQLDSEETLLRAGKFSQVDREATDLIANHGGGSLPDSWKAYYLRARARTGLGQVDLAKSDIRVAIKLRPPDKIGDR